MEQNLENLNQTLQKLIKFHRELLELVRSEKTALVEVKTKAVQDITYKKEVLLNTIFQVESQRIKDTANIIVHLKNPKKVSTLTDIVKEVENDHPEYSKKFLSAYHALNILIKRISEQNAENKTLVDHCLLHVKKMKTNVLGEKEQFSSTYTSQGKAKQSSAGSRFVTKEA